MTEDENPIYRVMIKDDMIILGRYANNPGYDKEVRAEFSKFEHRGIAIFRGYGHDMSVSGEEKWLIENARKRGANIAVNRMKHTTDKYVPWVFYRTEDKEILLFLKHCGNRVSSVSDVVLNK